MTRILLALAVTLATAGAWGATVTPFPNNPNAVLIVADGTAYLVVHNKPIVSWVIGDVPDPQPNPDPQPTPAKVSGILILEEQADRTVAQAKVLLDPVWQSMWLLRGKSLKIEDDDHPSVKPAVLKAAGPTRPVVVLIGSSGAVVGVKPLPATVEAMRELIGGVK